MKVVERLTSTLPPQPLVGHFGLSRLLCFKEMVRVSFGGAIFPNVMQRYFPVYQYLMRASRRQAVAELCGMLMWLLRCGTALWWRCCGMAVWRRAV